MLGQIHEHARKGESFAFETTLSGRGYARLIPRWQGQGYQVKLFFLRLPTADMAIARVKQRVREGGHDVPVAVYGGVSMQDGTILRRFIETWRMSG